MRNLRRFYAVAIAIAMLVGMLAPATVFAAETTTADENAKVLYDLKLYKGLSETEFQPDLTSTLNRQTGATMLLRLFGKEEDALALDPKTARADLAKTFKDAAEVDEWAVRQVAYAVQEGIIKGMTADTIGPKGLLTGRQYCTLILKSLGYSDFTFENAGKKLAEVAKLTAAEQAAFDATGAIKKEVLVNISRKALDTKPEGSENTLLQELVLGGTLKEDAVVEVIPDFVPSTTEATTSPEGTPEGDPEGTPGTNPEGTPDTNPEGTPGTNPEGTPGTSPVPTSTSTSVVGGVYGSVEVVNDLTAGNLIVGSTLNKVFKFKLSAPADQDLVLTSILASEFGTAAGDTTDIQRVYLLEDETVLVAGSLNNGEARLNKSVVVAKGTSKTYTLAVDINSSSSGATRTVIVGLASSSAITSTPAITPFTTAMQGGTYTIISASVGAVSTITAGTNVGGNIKVGDVNKDLGDFSITPSSTEDIKVTNITLNSTGFNLANLNNFYLYDDTFTKIDVLGKVDGSKVVFNLGDKGVLIPKSNTKKFYLKGDITMGSSTNVDGRFTIQNNYDIVAKGMNSGVNVGVPSAQVPKNLSTAVFTIAAGTVSLTDTSNVPTVITMTSAYKGMIREWLVTTPGEQLNIDRVDITVTPSALNDIDSEIQSFYLTDDKNNVIAGPFTCPSTTAGGTAAVAFTDVNYFVPANSSLKIQLKATAINDSIVGSFGVDASINASGFDYTLQTTNTVVTTFPASAVPSTYVTKDIVTGSTITITKDESFIAVSRPIGSKQTTIGKWLFASEDDKTKITKIRITTTATLVSNVSNMTLYVDGTKKGTAAVSPVDATADYFDVDLSSDPLYIDDGVTKQLEFRADLDAATDYGYDFSIAASDLTAFAVSTSVEATKSGTILANHISVTTAGTLGLGAPISDQVIAGKALGNTEVELVRARFTATNEPINLNQIQLTGITNVSGSTRAIKNIKVYELGQTTPIGALASFAAGAQYNVTTVAIPISNLEIAASGNKVIVVKGELDKDSFTSGNTVTFGIYGTTTGTTTKGKGVLSSRDIYLASATAVWGGTLTQVDAKAEVTLATDSPSGTSSQTATMSLMKFTVKAVGGDIYITPATITLTTGGTISAAFTANNFKLYKVNSDGTETCVAGNAATTSIGGGVPSASGEFMINDTDGTALYCNGDLAISKDTTATFILRTTSTSAFTAVADKTLSVALTGLRIADGASTGSPSTIYLGDGNTNPIIAGNALKF